MEKGYSNVGLFLSPPVEKRVKPNPERIPNPIDLNPARATLSLPLLRPFSTNDPPSIAGP